MNLCDIVDCLKYPSCNGCPFDLDWDDEVVTTEERGRLQEMFDLYMNSKGRGIEKTDPN